MRNRSSTGFTVIELVIVMAIIGILASIGTISWNLAARRSAAQGAVATFQQSVWQGATAAASRGITVELVRDGNHLVLLNTDDDGARLRSYELPNDVGISVGNPILTFLPPGKVSQESLDALSGGLVIDTGEGRYRLEISLIGEVRATLVEGE